MLSASKAPAYRCCPVCNIFENHGTLSGIRRLFAARQVLKRLGSQPACTLVRPSTAAEASEVRDDSFPPRWHLVPAPEQVTILSRVIPVYGWYPESQGGTVAVDSGRVASGSRAGRIRNEAVGV